jgi:hypothetical protein
MDVRPSPPETSRVRANCFSMTRGLFLAEPSDPRNEELLDKLALDVTREIIGMFAGLRITRDVDQSFRSDADQIGMTDRHHRNAHAGPGYAAHLQSVVPWSLVPVEVHTQALRVTSVLMPNASRIS